MRPRPSSSRGSRRSRLVALTLVGVLICFSGAAVGQELVPRAYWPTPNGINVFVLGYQRNTGDIVTDPSLPVSGVESEIDFLQLSYQRTFSAWGRTATMQLSVPYSEGRTEGLVEGEFVRRDVAGLGDARARFAINLKGAPSMDVAGFQELRRNPRTIVGASLLIQAPTGEWESGRVINVGTNRWAAKPAVGVIWPIRPTWLFEFEVGAWFFGDNTDFLGETRKQDPILSTEFHLVKRIRPGFWMSLDANFYVGGETRIGTEEAGNLQRNSRVGLTAVFPMKTGHAFRGSVSTGAVTESGGDFEIFSLAYIYVW